MDMDDNRIPLNIKNEYGKTTIEETKWEKLYKIKYG
jgi:hypothetical protein